MNKCSVHRAWASHPTHLTTKTVCLMPWVGCDVTGILMKQTLMDKYRDLKFATVAAAQ